MGLKVTLDTNIFLNVKNKEEKFYSYSKKILDAVDRSEIEAIVSIITIAELCVGYYKNKEIKDKEDFIAGLYANKSYKIIDFGLKLADMSGDIKNTTHLKLPDCIIIASSILEQVPILITNDSKFDKAKELLKIMTPETFCNKYIKKEEEKGS